MQKYYYEGSTFKLWRGSWNLTFKFWRGSWVPLLNFEGGPESGSQGPEVLFPLLHHAWKLQHQILFKHIFWLNYHVSNFFWNLWCQTNQYSSKTVNIWTASVYFPFFISFFCWNETNKKPSKEDTHSACNFIQKRDFTTSVVLWILRNF